VKSIHDMLPPAKSTATSRRDIINYEVATGHANAAMKVDSNVINASITM